MLIFFFICALMVLLALSLILPPLLQSPADAKTEDARAANLLVYQDQLRELEADVNAGLLAETQFEQDKEDIERRVLEDVGDVKRSRTPTKIATRKVAYAVAVVIPVAAILFYLIVGSPKALDPPPVSPPNIGAR
ncbi:MAG TPA: c-type cytochrome biogenesis protein CcmI [Pyrinomonadaceae bacterium]|jgi:cytochrome c-type biogenesis protein CcmH|nr:c-type cytochrome biogenesis protein CcmI [Pyrinomonadaceae bacterium]